MNIHSFCNTEIIFLNQESFQNKILSLNLKRIILVISKNGAKRWGLIDFISELRERCEFFVWVDSVPSNPTHNDIADSLKIVGLNKVDTIIAIGGGSSIDLAKGISVFYNPNKAVSSENIRESIKNKLYLQSNGLDIIAVPTTSGTGSEVTQWATVWDIENKEKYSIDCPQIKPKLACIVPEFTLSLSELMTLSTGLDALSHAVEAYWSKYTTPFVQDIAMRSIEIITLNLKRVLEHPDDIIFRERMCCASLLAGLAFSQTRTTACHAISYPLTLYYGVPHGFAVALTLDGVAKLNKGHFQRDDELFSLFNNWGGINGWMHYVCDNITDLSIDTFGVDNLELIAEKSLKNGRMENNPYFLSTKDIIDILSNK